MSAVIRLPVAGDLVARQDALRAAAEGDPAVQAVADDVRVEARRRPLGDADAGRLVVVDGVAAKEAARAAEAERATLG